MEDYRAETYGERNADVYDDWHADLDPTAAVHLLASLAADGPPGPVLELAVGTGRVAIPLAARGVDVRGIDASEAMLERLKAKTGGDRVPVTVGDMADVHDGTDDRFSLVFIAFTTIFFLLSQDDQVRCFANVARRLVPGGRFVLECLVPDLTRFTRGQSVEAHHVDVDGVRLTVARHSAARQQVDAHHVRITNEGVRVAPLSMRYAWPSELDLMARLAGLDLRHRWGGWRREPFDDTSAVHVSVYERPPAS